MKRPFASVVVLRALSVINTSTVAPPSGVPASSVSTTRRRAALRSFLLFERRSQAFITAENINELIGRYTACADIGLLSIDIDGNDYWVWNAIEVINPRIVVCEYNSAFGDTLPVSVPYDPRFEKTKAHYSQLYYGCSLAALCYLAGRKGYDFVGTTSAGVNAYFVRKDLSAPFKTYTAKTGFHESANRDSRHPNGALSFLPHGERLKQIADLKLVDVTNGTLSAIQELYGL